MIPRVDGLSKASRPRKIKDVDSELKSRSAEGTRPPAAMPKRTRQIEGEDAELDLSLEEIFSRPASDSDKLCLASTEWIGSTTADFFAKVSPFIEKMDQESMEVALFKQVHVGPASERSPEWTLRKLSRTHESYALLVRYIGGRPVR